MRPYAEYVQFMQHALIVYVTDISGYIIHYESLHTNMPYIFDYTHIYTTYIIHIHITYIHTYISNIYTLYVHTYTLYIYTVYTYQS